MRIEAAEIMGVSPNGLASAGANSRVTRLYLVTAR
ncbi:hypothetical protein CGLAMM_08940 [Acetobacteraceae bacterium EV16G]|uniref:Transposase n=1 Tax=Sorlinia euscelidii TaxID=3081148 RepID=A0ABU7TYW7_9PROT